MEKLVNRILALFCCVVTLFSLVVPASASVSDWVDYYAGTFWEYINSLGTQSSWTIAGWWQSVVGSDDPDTAYSSYVTGLDSTLGTYTVTNNGLRLYFSALSAYKLVLNVAGVNFDASRTVGTSANAGYVTFNNVYAPFDCTFQVGYQLSVLNCNMDQTYASLWSGTVAKSYALHPGLDGSVSLYFYSITPNTLQQVSGFVYVDVVPVTGTVSDNTTADVSSDTRAGSLAGDLYYLGDDGQQIVAKNVTIVDESADTYYNPTTGDITDITNWNYDYSDRSYNVTTTSGDTYTITYGDEYMTVNEGDTVYTYYYAIPSDDSGTTTDDSAGWDWWKTEWTDFRTWLSGLSFAGGGDSSELTDSPESSGSSSSSSSGDTSAFYSIDDVTGDITINQDYDYSGEEDGLDFGGVVKATGKGIWWLAKSVIGIFAGAITNVGSAVSGLAKIGKASNTTGAYGFFFQ